MPHSALIVEDDPPLRGLLQTLLRHAGEDNVVSCSDGDEAIALLVTRSFDVILLDLMMPGTDGLAVIEFLRQHRPSQLRVVLVMTAATDEVTERLDPSVVHGVILKPFDNDAVVGLVLEIFQAAPGG
ncbi:MAG TPA: response regulator [Thermoanaerobaculia bacterium]|nr:response regulator [Thermoanaerobaculia bacterium]